MKKSLLIFVLGFLVLTLCSSEKIYAQKAKLKKAEKLFEAFSFPEAAKIYKQVAEGKGTPEAIINLAECYRLMNKPEEAETWYAQVVELPEAEDIHFLRYGLVLKINDKCEEAKEYFLEYANRVPADSRGIRQVEACESAEYFKTDPKIYDLKITDINSSFSDFGPAYFEDGIIFSSARGMRFEDKVYNWTDTPYLDLYTAQQSEEKGEPWNLKKAQIFKGKTNSVLHEGTVTFSEDGETMYFTRNNYIKGKKGKDSENTVRLKIYSVEKKDGKWSDIKELPFNSDEYSVGHPTLSADGNALYFASDMPGGVGNEDIYVSYKEGDSWGAPQNLGSEINTEGREMFPFIHEDGTLYFASDALPGLGGLDIFETQQVDEKWIKPQNLRKPINSDFDDFGLILNTEKTEGYLASNRFGGEGDDDIYAFTKTTDVLKGMVVDCNTNEPLEGATIVLFEGDEKMQEQTSYESGEFNFSIKEDKNFTVKANRINYTESEVSITTVDISNPDFELIIPICPEESVSDNGEGTGENGEGNNNGNSNNNNTNTTNGIDLSIKCELIGKVFDKNTGKPLANTEVILTNKATNYSSTVTTDADGTYRFDVEREMEFLLTARKKQYYSITQAFSTKGRDCSKPTERDIPLNLYISEIDVNLNNPSLIPDDVLVLNHIYYDLDKDYIRDDAAIELDKVVKLLYDNPGIIVELGSHTDARASDGYNMKLSQRRAQSAVDYVVGKGIASDRISAVGYGETQLLNECSNGTKCAENKHQENRRTEFKVVGYRANAVYSQPRYFGTGDYYDTATNTSYFSNDSDVGNTSNGNNGFTTYADDTYTSTSTTTDNNFTNGQEFKIQLGAFTQMPNVNDYENTLSDLGYSITTEYINGTNKIVMGSFYDRTTAEEILQRVKSRAYPDAFIVIYNNGVRR